MGGERKRLTAQEKVAILRRHFLEKVPVSTLCEEHGLNPTVFYRWQKELFENGAAAFEHRPEGHPKRTFRLVRWRCAGSMTGPGVMGHGRQRASSGMRTSVSSFSRLAAGVHEQRLIVNASPRHCIGLTSRTRYSQRRP